jgi:predicted RNA-binding protein YlxR (DUF448 family)
MRTKNINGRRIKVQPQRTCVACRLVGDKRGLVRLVRTSDASVVVDTSGKLAGRGAYLCHRRECWESGIAGGKLERSLNITLTPENREQLTKLGQDLVKESVIG